MNEVIPLPNPVLPPERQCQIEEVFESGFIELMRLVPRNPLVRATILKRTGKLPASQCATFEQLKDWIEWNCDANSLPAFNRRSTTGTLTIPVQFSDVEYGRADYSVSRSGTGEFCLESEDLLEIIHAALDADEGIDEVVEVIAGRIDDDAWELCEPCMDDSGDYDYSEHEFSDSSSSEVRYSHQEIRETVLAFVRDRYPDLAAEL